MIKLDSPGPFFFPRRGPAGAADTFEMLKFRTVVEGADAKPGSSL